MSDFNLRVQAFAKHGMNACDRLAENHKELFLSISVRDAFEKIVALTRMRDTIEPPRSEQEAYDAMEALLAELLYDGRLAVPKFGLSQDGQESCDYFVDLHANGRKAPITDPTELFADVVHLYRTDMAAFHERRANDPDFLRRSNEANSLRLL
jgi:hypothetical protein